MRAGLSPQMQGHLAMLVFSALVAGSFSLGSLAANQIAPTALNTVRFFIAAIPIGILAWLTGGFTAFHWLHPGAIWCWVGYSRPILC